MVVDYILSIAQLSPDLWTVSRGTVGGQSQSNEDQINFPFYSWKATHSLIYQKKKNANSPFQMAIPDKLRKS